MVNKWQKFLLAAASVFLLSSSGGNITPQEANLVAEPPYEVKLHFFYSESCGYCSQEKTFLKSITDDSQYDNVTIVSYLIDANLKSGEANPDYATNMQLLENVADVFNFSVGVPTTALGGKAFSGFDVTIRYFITQSIERYSQTPQVDVVTKIIEEGIEAIEPSDLDDTKLEVKLPFLGVIDPQAISLGLVSVVLGFVDGFNPCAMWVLLFLISLLLPNHDRKRIFILGGVFILTSALFYFALMMAWVNTAVFIATNLAFRIIVGVFALAAGGYNLYQFIKNVREKDVGCEVTDEKRRNKLMERVRKIITQNKLILALVGVISLALIVNFIELACSAGVPLVFAYVLALNGLSGWAGAGYVLLYIFFFVLDDIIVFFIVMFTLKLRVVSNKISFYNHLIGGILMLVIGILMIFFPAILQFNFLS